MSGIFRTVEITWGGKPYQITPSMGLMRVIESNGVSMYEMSQQLAQGRPQISHVATAIAIMLQSVGVDVSDEDVYAHLMQTASGAEVSAMFRAVVIGFSPQGPDEKKADAQTGRQSPARAPAKRRKETGIRCTCTRARGAFSRPSSGP
jgi:phage terminase large subunit GpA-like protein